jgi:hypothetical protein
MNSLIDKFNNIDIGIKTKYVIGAPPTIFASTHFYLTGFESDEVIDIISNFLKDRKYNVRFINQHNIVNWTVYKLYKNDLDFPYCEYSIAIYLKNKEYIIEVFKLFGKDDIFMDFYKSMEDLFR